MADITASPLRSPRTYHAELTEGEVDLIIALLSLCEGEGSEPNSPVKYAARLYKAFTRAAGYDESDSDAFKLSVGSVWFTSYGRLDDETMLRRPPLDVCA